MTTRPAFDWSLLESIQVERRRERETQRQRLLTEVTNDLRKYQSRQPGLRFHVFGSLAQPGAFGLESDIDLAIEGLPPSAYWRVLREVEDLLQRENLNLVELERCSFASQIRKHGLAV